MKTITKSLQPALMTLALAIPCLALLPPGKAAMPEPVQPDKEMPARLNESYGRLPLSFEANEGQQDREVKFLSRGSGYNLFLTNQEAVLLLTKPEKPAASTAKQATDKAVSQKPKGQSTVLRMQLVAANPAAKVTGEEELPGKVNYLTGKDSSKWRCDVATYAKVRYKQVYPGVDLLYYGNQRQLEYDFVIAPGADPARIRLRITGAQKIQVNRQGEVVARTAGGAVRWHKPQIYQVVDGQHRSVKGKYVVRRGHEISFQVAAYDTAKPLIVDPTLVYSTYLGSQGQDRCMGIAVDTSGNAYVSGVTDSSNFPTTPGAFQTTNHGGNFLQDVFVIKLNPTGTGLVYSTYLGGSSDDFTGYGNTIAVDASGNAYVTGETDSSDFPTTAGAFQTTKHVGTNVFVTKLNSIGTGLLYSTYLGGDDVGTGIAVDTSGNAYVTGQTVENFPTTPGAFHTTGGGVFVTKLNPTGTSLIYSTLLGDNGGSGRSSIAVDISGNAYVAGTTSSSVWPTTPGAFQTTKNGSAADVFVTKLNPTGSGLLYSTYVGGTDGEDAWGIALDTSGNAYVTGFTDSNNFPTTAGAFQTTRRGVNLQEGFVTKLNPCGTGLVYSTYLGGSSSDAAFRIAVDTSGNAYVTGYTVSNDFPTTPGAFQTTLAGDDAFLTQINSTGTGLLYSTYLGGAGGEDIGNSIAVDTSGYAYVTGYTHGNFTSGNDFPTTAGAFQTTPGGPHDDFDGFVAKFSLPAPTPTSSPTPPAPCPTLTPTPTPTPTPIPNSPPVAINDFYGVDQLAALNELAPGVLANDSDPNTGDTLTASLVTGPSHASSFHLNSNGSFTYAPVGNYYGPDTFTYQAYDGRLYSNLATVTITVRQPCSFGGFVTGGGKFFQNTRKCTFGFTARMRNNLPQGNLEFQDHDVSIDLEGTVTWVYVPSVTDGSFGGACSLNHITGYTYFVQLHDRGEPGNNDDFSVWIYDSYGTQIYTSSGPLSGGNIQIHDTAVASGTSREWFCDNDVDGYYASYGFSCTAPVGFGSCVPDHPGGSGLDCNDNDPYVTYNGNNCQ